ncbi:MAG: hypothetical protein NTX22_02950 [Ignavibacteriales bacterium]|nr:hypothetical protein [Ignavibacteriales bacterium]
MFNIEKISLSFTYSAFFFILGAILIVAYSVYVYRHTIPQVNQTFKIFLVSLRTLALLMILFAIFEPILSLTRKKIIEPVNLIFIDNSKSIQIADGTDRKESINEFLTKAKNAGLFKNSELFSFGSKANKKNPDSLNELKFAEPSTNFAKLFASIKNEENNISSISIISDGVITEGVNPLYNAEKLGIPIFTIGVGDTTKKNNIEIRKVLINEYVYAETPTTISVTISNTGFKNKNVTLSLFEDNQLMEKQNINLNNEELSTATLTYTPRNAGEKKITISVNELSGESSAADNKKIVYVNVLNNKIHALILAGSPSADLSFIKNSLSSDPNLKVSSITQIASNKFLESIDRNKLIDSADVLYLVGFPSQQTSSELLNKVLQAIRDKNKPFFIVLSSGLDYNKLKLLQPELPFTIKTIAPGSNEVQPSISFEEMEDPLLKSNAQNVIEAWNNLPPINKDNTELLAKPESKVLAKIKMNNIPINAPLILTRKLGSKHAIAILAKDIWKWKLQTAEKNLDLFDRFFSSSVKWMNTKEDQKLVSIKSSKKIYSLGEPVEFTAQVYNETLNPVDDAEILVNVKSGQENYSVSMNSIGGGIYEGTLAVNKSGDFKFDGIAKLNGKTLGTDIGKFSIGDVEIEMVNPRMDKEFLNLLSVQTGGKFFFSKDYSQYFNLIKSLSERKSNIKLIKSEFNIWSSEWLLIIAVLLFGIEWFFRKRSGML